MLGKLKGDDYLDLPYLEGWKPIPDREWALAFIGDDGTENFTGFRQAFKQHYPKMSLGAIDGWMPESVDHFVRHDERGVRQDIDWELAAIPRTEDEIAEMKRSRANLLKQRRNDALRARAKKEPAETPPAAPKPERKGMSAEARAAQAQRMRDMHAKKKAQAQETASPA